jgi:GTPase SAR1 family protein
LLERENIVSIENVTTKIPEGFRLHSTLGGHTGIITRPQWSPDGKFLATPSWDGTIRLWDLNEGKVIRTLVDPGQPGIWYNEVVWSPDSKFIAACGSDSIARVWNLEEDRNEFGLYGHTGKVTSLSWHKDGTRMATGSTDSTVRVWDSETYEQLWIAHDHSLSINKVAWAPDGSVLASASDDWTIRIWGERVGLPQKTLDGHQDRVNDIVWSPDQAFIASASSDFTVRIWDVKNGRQIVILEGHFEAVMSVGFSADGKVLASRSNDGFIHFWRCDSWDQIGVLNEVPFVDGHVGLSFHPKLPILVTQAEEDKKFRLWELDLLYLFGQAPEADTVHYTNAKVILVGDTGVGKTGLGLVLTDRPFVATESSHSRHVWTMQNETVRLSDGREETREILLWDLAGQPGYRMIHQLYLNEVAIALVLFDSRSEKDPFSAVRHWARALNQSQRVSSGGINMRKFLVASRVDRGGIGATEQRVHQEMDRFGFVKNFETSAKEGWDIPELQKAIAEHIDWDSLPKVSSTQLFQKIREFLVAQKESGIELITFDELFDDFEAEYGDSIRLMSFGEESDASQVLRTQFETCIGRVESRGLIRRLSFGNLILLQPELLDAYASSIINFVKRDPDGLGTVLELDIREGNFPIPNDQRVTDRAKENLLIIATVEDMMRYEIALREKSGKHPILVFPSELTKESLVKPAPEGQTIIYTFEGPTINIYATLVVRLSRSGIFVKKEIYQNQVSFKDTEGKLCGITFRDIEEGKGELTIFFDSPQQKSRSQFEEYILLHLKRWSIPETLFSRSIVRCEKCGMAVTEQMIQLRQERGFNWMYCPVCTHSIALGDNTEKVEFTSNETMVQIDQSAEAQREIDMAASIFQGKLATREFDVLLCYTPNDRVAAFSLANQLKTQAILPWLVGEKNISNELKEVPVLKAKAIIFFLDKDKQIGPGQPKALVAFLRKFAAIGCPIIPVTTSGAIEPPNVTSVTKISWINLLATKPDPVELIVHNVTRGRGKTSHRQPNVWISAEVGQTTQRELSIIDLGRMKELVKKQFTTTQQNQLLSQLHFDYSNSSGDPISELIKYCDRRGYMQMLVKLCRDNNASFPY